VTGERLAREAVRVLDDPGALERMRADLRDVRSKLGGGGATARAADIAISLAAR